MTQIIVRTGRPPALILVKTIPQFSFLLVIVIQECEGEEIWPPPLTSAGRNGSKHMKRLKQQRLEAALEEGLEETFPASDAPAVTQPRRQAVPVSDFGLARS